MQVEIRVLQGQPVPLELQEVSDQQAPPVRQGFKDQAAVPDRQAHKGLLDRAEALEPLVSKVQLGRLAQLDQLEI